MKFKDLLKLNRDRGGGIPMATLLALDLPVPEDVLEQVMSDHGAKSDFQDQYGELDLTKTQWELVELPATEIVACSCYRIFKGAVDLIAGQFEAAEKTGWKNISPRAKAVAHWRKHGTWSRPPVLIRGSMVGKKSALHLVEGHTRVGALTGLVRSGIVDSASSHRVWLGSNVSPVS